MKIFTKVTCKRMTIFLFLQHRLHSKLVLFGEEKGKSFISSVGKIVNISVKVLSYYLKSLSRSR